MCDYLEQPGIKGSIRFILISKFEKPLIIGKNKIQKVSFFKKTLILLNMN